MVEVASRRTTHKTINIVSIDSIPIDHLSSLSCPALQLNTPKPKRERFQHKHTSPRQRHSERARLLADLLREQRRAFPGFASRIDQFIAQVEADANRTRKSDREKVLECLRSWSEGLRVTEIMDDTGLSYWDVRQILRELVSNGTVQFSPKPPTGIAEKNWKKPRLYRLKNLVSHKRPDSVSEESTGKV